ncbi:MAG TPA: hypothetical protein PLA74_07745 [Syntrophales bacterium]|nr:hypothetical protein [Syntrophales bacterium]HPQ43579.1 hypothetical protein [Syntrophales bacterium]
MRNAEEHPFLRTVLITEIDRRFFNLIYTDGYGTLTSPILKAKTSLLTWHAMQQRSERQQKAQDREEGSFISWIL